MHNDHFSRHAQQVLTVTRGQELSQGPGSDPSIARSWLRCVEDYLAGRRFPLDLIDHVL